MSPQPDFRVLNAAPVGNMVGVLCYNSQNRTFYLAGTTRPFAEVNNTDPRYWPDRPEDFLLRELPDLHNIVPQFDSQIMTKVKNAYDPRSYIKEKTDVLGVADFLNGLHKLYVEPYDVLQRNITAREITICEILRKNPHCNIAEYRGVLTDTKISSGHGKSKAVLQRFASPVVTGLSFKKYDGTLHDAVLNSTRRPFAALKAMSDISAGLKHMHSLGLVHADVKPSNVFVDYRNQPFNPSAWVFVIGDFDSTHAVGEEYNYKVGTPGWMGEECDEEGSVAKVEHDFYGLQAVKWWLKAMGWGKMEKGKEYPSVQEVLHEFRIEQILQARLKKHGDVEMENA